MAVVGELTVEEVGGVVAILEVAVEILVGTTPCLRLPVNQIKEVVWRQLVLVVELVLWRVVSLQ